MRGLGTETSGACYVIDQRILLDFKSDVELEICWSSLHKIIVELLQVESTSAFTVAYLSYIDGLSLQVENQSGLSNFIPILIGDKETCKEMEVLQRKFEMPFSSQEQELSSPQPACKVFASRHADYSELVLDVAWLLKKPISEQNLTSSHIQRLNCLLEHLMENESSVILEGLYCSCRSAMDNNLFNGNSDFDVRLLHKIMDTARRRLAPKLHKKEFPEMPAPNRKCYSHSSENNITSASLFTNQVH